MACREVGAFGALGRFRANGPIAAHPPVRMRRIPPGVVLTFARRSERDTPDKALVSISWCSSSCGRAGRTIVPRMCPQTQSPQKQGLGAIRSPAQSPMLKKFGKFYARWTGVDGKRHVKACKTERAARKVQREMQAERQAKKAPATPPRRSRRSGRARAARSITRRSRVPRIRPFVYGEAWRERHRGTKIGRGRLSQNRQAVQPEARRGKT